MAVSSPWFWFKVAALAFVLAIGMNFVWWVVTHPVGATHHGIVAEELCNGGSPGAYVLVDFGNGSTHSYPVRYKECIEFLYHHRQGVTLQDNAWQDGIEWYRFDGVAK